MVFDQNMLNGDTGPIYILVHKLELVEAMNQQLESSMF